MNRIAKAGLLVCAAFIFVSAAQAACQNGLNVQTSAVPRLPGRAAYQGFDANNQYSQLYVFDFGANPMTQTNISSSWGTVGNSLLSNFINPAFSPDGKYIAFTAINTCKSNMVASHDVYVWQIGQAFPVDMTPDCSGNTRTEDAKWTLDGQGLLVEQNANVWRLNLSFNASGASSVVSKTQLTTDGAINTSSENSAPVSSADGKYIYFTRGVGTTRGVFKITSNGGAIPTKSFSLNGHYAYYPIVRDLTTIFYNGAIDTTSNDHVLMQAPGLVGSYVDGSFNDCGANDSDPTSVDSDYFLYSSTSASVSSGPYRPVIANIATGKVWTLQTIGLGSGIAGDIDGLNYSTAR